MYKVIKRAISRELAEFCYNYFCNKRNVARLFFDAEYISQLNLDWGCWNDQQIPETYSHYGDLVMETLLQKIKWRMEMETELKLNETYSYARIYKKGDVLERHKDRYSCEASATMNLGGDPWPIFLEPSGKEGEEGLRVLLDHGDMLINRGDYEHWREPFEGENCGQVYLHYNDISKEENKYDRRPFLGLPPWFKGYEL